MSNIHFTGLDNVKMTCITQVSIKITFRKRHVSLTFVDLENETSISTWQFEKMNVQK